MQEIVGEGEEYVPYMFRPFTSHVVLKKLSKSIYFKNTYHSIALHIALKIRIAQGVSFFTVFWFKIEK